MYSKEGVKTKRKVLIKMW